MEVEVCVPAEEVAGKSAADDGRGRGDEMEASIGMAAHQDATSPSSYLFAHMSDEMLTCERLVLVRTP